MSVATTRSARLAAGGHLMLIGLGLIGWAICGATIGIGRRLMSLDAALIVHALVAPAVFAFLAWIYAGGRGGGSALVTALTLVSVVVAMDALVVAPFVEHSYAMFGSVLGTWIPFGSIAAASYLAAQRRHAGVTRW